MTFSDWLASELNKRDMSQADLARKSDLTRGAVSHLINQQRQPGPDACLAIARALSLPPELVFRQAGLLPSEEIAHNVSDEIIAYKVSELSQSQKDQVLQFIEFLQEQGERSERRSSYKENREGITPPETINK